MSLNRLESRLYWKDLSDDGLLKDPQPEGPYYDTDDLNTTVYGIGFETREEAVNRLVQFKKDNHFVSGNFVLIEIWS